MDLPRSAVVIGDSAIAAIRWVPGADNAVIGFRHVLDLESCRRLYAPSCRGREGRTPPTVFEVLTNYRRSQQVAIIATGYNDGVAQFADSFRAVVAQARALGFAQIVWWTLRSDVDYVSPGSIGNHQAFAANNATLRALVATGEYPDVVLADWGAYSADRPEWFVTDGVHYRALGAWAASDYLSRKMAFLDERPCPMPTGVGGVPENPCPDPDVTGPVSDIAGLYPIGTDGVLCYEVGVERVFECRIDTHVIRLTRELFPEMVGDDVQALQTRLHRLDVFHDDVSGTYGSATVEAVRKFQAAAGLPITGVANTATLAELGFDIGGVS